MCCNSVGMAQGLIVNEFSQGTSGTKEYFEFVVVGTRTCTDSTLDLTGWIFDDNNGWYGSSGVAGGHMRFTNVANWRAVPYGSIILVYNDGDINGSIVSQNVLPDPTDANHDHVYVLGISNSTYLEEASTPTNGGGSATFTYAGSSYSPGGSWTGITLSNTSADGVVVTSPANLGSAYHSVTFGAATIGGGGYQTPTAHITTQVAGGETGYLSDANYTSSASYLKGNAPGDETPGKPNTTANAAWINSMLVQVGGSGSAPRLGSNSPVCAGQTLMIVDSTTGGTYSWTAPNGSTSTQQNITIPNATAADSGIYTLTVGSGACTATGTISVAVVSTLPAPSIASNSPVCNGDTINLSSSTATSGVTYHWAGPAGFTSTQQYPQIVGATATNAGTYTVYVSTSGCQSSTVSTAVTVANPVKPIIYADSIACTGTTLLLTTDSVAGATYTWIGPNNFSSHLQDPSIPNVNAVNAGTYGLYVSYSGCNSSTATKIITVNPTPAAPTGSNVSYCQNAIAAPLTANGTNLLFYTSPTGGTPLGSAPVPSTATPGTTTFYVSQITTVCESPRVPITVTVNPAPGAGIAAATRPSYCQYDTLTVAFAGTVQPGNTYTWTVTPAATVLSGSLQSPGPITFRFDNAGSIDIKIEVSNGVCSSKSLYLAQVNAIPDAELVVKKEPCLNEAIGIGLTDRNNLKNYTVVYPGASLIQYDEARDVYYVKWGATGTYIITATLNSYLCPSAVVSDTVTVHDLPSVQIQGPTTGTTCIGEATAVNAIDPNAGNLYTWGPAILFPDGKNQGPFVMPVLDAHTVVYVYASDAYGCTGTDSIALTSEACCSVYFPTGFTPNNDGKNDEFKPITDGNHKLNNFVVENRYGQMVYESRDEHKGWNGKLGGVDQPIGTYYYFIRFVCANGKEITQKGSVELIR